MKKESSNFLKKIANLIVYIVTLLGIFSLTSKRLDPEILLTSTFIILFAGFIFLVIAHVQELEKKIKEIETKFISEKRLNKLETNIKALNLKVIKNE